MCALITLSQALRLVATLQTSHAVAATAAAAAAVAVSRTLLLVDVRSTAEVVKSGKMPSAINIPLTIFADVLDPRGRVTGDEFVRVFGVGKPTSAYTRLLLYSSYHTRAVAAADVASEYGFDNTLIIHGGWTAWCAHFAAR